MSTVLRHHTTLQRRSKISLKVTAILVYALLDSHTSELLYHFSISMWVGFLFFSTCVMYRV